MLKQTGQKFLKRTIKALKIALYFLTHPPYTKNTLRIGYWRSNGITIAENSVISSGVVLGTHNNIGSNCRLGKNIIIGNKTIIGDFSVIDSNVKIGNDCKLGKHVIVKPGSVIGNSVSILDNSLVNGFVPDNCLVKGRPYEITGFKNPDSYESTNTGSNNDFLGSEAIDALLKKYNFTTVLDIGSGSGRHANIFTDHGKNVTCIDLGKSKNFSINTTQQAIIGNYLEYDFKKKFDCIWACHVLEHQLNPNVFLRKIYSDLEDEGILAITVPPLKPEIVGGHVTLWNAGLLIYNLILAGFDCSEAAILQYQYNISVILHKKAAILPQLDYDTGDILRLQNLFPFDVIEGFDGRIQRCNWPINHTDM